MKHKTFYIIILIFSVSILSSANQSEKTDNSSCCIKKLMCKKRMPEKPVDITEFEFSPVSWLGGSSH